MKPNTFPCLLAALVGMAQLTLAQERSVSDLLKSLQLGTALAQTPQPAPIRTQAAPPATPTPPPALDTKAVFMTVLTNRLFVTNRVIVTNYVVITNLTFTTNYYNAQGQLLTLVPNATLPVAEAKPAAPPAPDPAVIRANRLQAVRDLLIQGSVTASNTLSVQGSFTSNPQYQIRIPEGIPVLDRKRALALTTAMNTAAERAIPGVLAVLQKSIGQWNPPDPAQLIQEGTDGITRYLVANEGQNLANQFLPVVQAAAAEARVPEAYNAAMLRGGGLLGAVLGTSQSVDINSHITRGVLEAIVANLSAEENQVRTFSAARKTKALQEAFGK